MTAAFTPEELKTVAQAPILTGLAVSMVDLGIVSTVPEAAALSKEVAGAAAKYPSNSVIQAVFSQAAAKSGTLQVEKPQVKPEDVQSGKIVDDAIAAIQSAVSLLEGRVSAEEIAQYKGFVYEAAEAVANAAGSGLFSSGEKVSAKEASALAKLRAILVG